MSYPHVFGAPGMGGFADKMDLLCRALKEVTMPTKDGTGSPTAIAQYAFHSAHYLRLTEDGKQSWRDFLRVQVNEAFSIKDPEELQEALVRVASVCAYWHQAIEERK